MDPNFLQKLEAEAAKQAKLEQHKVLPESLGALSAFVVRYPWQVLLVSSALVAWVFTAAGGVLP